jgi:hypothetical protein
MGPPYPPGSLRPQETRALRELQQHETVNVLIAGRDTLLKRCLFSMQIDAVAWSAMRFDASVAINALFARHFNF